MNVKIPFPTEEEVEVIAQRIMYDCPRLSRKQAILRARLELNGVYPDSLHKSS